MSGEEGPLNLPMSALFALVFAIIGIVLLMTIIFSGLKPYEQIARANADRLASAINEACFLTRDLTIKDFYLPQNTPMFSEVSSFAPALRIKSDGDPKYFLYYEMFQPGEAISWEVYHDFDYRAVAMLPYNLPADFDMHSFISDVKSFVFDAYKNDANPPKTVDVFISNLLLSGSIDPITGEALDAKSIAMGKWDGNKFVLNTGFFSSALNKTIPKYLACGDNKLCLKTPSAIYRYDLKHCEGIDYIQLARQYTPLRMWDKYSDFYLASPCKAGTVDVRITDCTDGIGSPVVGKCSKSIKYPIYEYVDGVLTSSGREHISCLDKIGENGDRDNIPGEYKANDQIKKCVRVLLDLDGQFCYTLNTAEPIVNYGLQPVEETNEYKQYDIGGKKYPVIVLKPASYRMFEIQNMLPLFNSWRWPN